MLKAVKHRQWWLPEAGHPVEVASPRGYQRAVAMWLGDDEDDRGPGWRLFAADRLILEDVTHWRPLGAGPEVGQ